LVYPFSFGGEQARVVAVIKQLPPKEFGTCKTVTGVEETDKSAAEIYRSTSEEFQLQSAIYRIYPNGIKTEPAATLEIDADPQEFVRPNSRSAAAGDATLYQWNPVARKWEPLKTSWFGNTAKAQVGQLSEYTTYVALMKRAGPISASGVSWEEISALSGYWNGKTSPHATVTALSQDGRTSQCESDANGSFRLPFRLNPGTNSYRLEFLPLEGKPYACTMDMIQKSGSVVTSQSPSLRLVGDSTISAGSKIIILCQDSSLADTNLKEKRSLIAQVQTSDFSKKFTVELAETIAGIGNFIGCILPPNTTDAPPDGLSMVTSCLPPHLANGTRLTISVGTVSLNLKVKDTEPTRISLTSSTHPCLLFATPENGTGISSATLHSQCKVALANNAWKISGVQGTPSARVANWPVSSFSVSSWPFIGFTYKLYSQAPWQLLIRSENKIQSFHFACKEAWFDPYAPADPLIADGNWNYWQRNLTEGEFKQIDSISFGSWIKTGYLRVEPGFLDSHRDSILIKSLWIGRSYPDRLVEIAWHAEDDSAIGQLDWWVDQDTDSANPPDKSVAKPIAKSLTGIVPPDGKCLFTLPDDGKWFFHIRANDIAGNASPVTSYPLIVYSTMRKSETLANSLLNPTAEQDVSWTQPDGTLQINLKGLGASLNPSSLIFRVGNIPYRLTKVNWNSSSEMLTITADSFEEVVPIGFDKEILSAKLEGQDIAGKPILNFPDLKIRMTSPFIWTAAADGGNLKYANYDSANQWVAFWKNPTPPWMNLFPGCVNNILVLTKGKVEHQLKPQNKWIRPIAIFDENIQNVYWQESWGDPTSKTVQLRDTLDKTAFAFDGSPATIPGRFLPRDPDKNVWIYVQAPTDSFEIATMRLITRPKGGTDVTLARASKKEVVGTLNSQEKNPIRIDGWLSPGEGTLYLKAPGKRDLQYATGMDSSYRHSNSQEVRIVATDEWTKFSIMITPKHDYKPTPGGVVDGIFYW
jgi:hypothetical protein